MIAIIVDPQQSPALYGLDDHIPLPLFPIVDRPLLHHIIEHLIGHSIRRFEFLLSHLPEKTEESLGNGERWGCVFRFHLFPEFGRPYRLVQAIAESHNGSVLIGRADRLPEMGVLPQTAPAAYVTASGDWTGWAVLPDSQLLSLLADDPTGEALLRKCNRVRAERELSFETASGFLRAQRDLMEGRFTGLTVGRREAEPGIWISRNVSLHPTVRLRAPVYIGPNSRICRRAEIGPNAVIGENCIVDERSSISESVIASGSYIGQALDVSEAIVDRNRLVNVRIGTSVMISETFLLGSLTGLATGHSIQQLFWRAVAALLFLVMSPVAALVYLYSWLGGRGQFVRQSAVRLPADDSPGAWREFTLQRYRQNGASADSAWEDFLFRVWPGLAAVVRGDLVLAGVSPRSREEIQALPTDWRSIYLRSRAGLITEAAATFGAAPTEDELYTAEAYYSATANFWHDLKLVAAYLAKLMSPVRRTVA